MNLREGVRLGRPATDQQRAQWVAFSEMVRAEPLALPFMAAEEPELYKRIVDGLRSLAVEVQSGDWRSWARPEQRIPGTEGASSDVTRWLVWLLMGGRGSGKSRTGAEATREMLLGREWRERPRWALVGQTLESVRIDMVENTLLEILPPGTVRNWNRGPCELYLSNGAFLKGFSSERPRALRGPNFHGAWADELATWKDADVPPSVDSTMSNLKLATRAHDQHTWVPRIVATTTPRAVALLRNPAPENPVAPGPGLYDDPLTVVSSMSTLDNLENLSESYLDVVVKPLEGTRLYDQEILGRLVDEVVGAQWSTELVAKMTYPPQWPETQGGGIIRAVIGVDPSIGAGLGDECGIVVSGLGADGRVYVLEDLSKRCPAREWVEIVAKGFARWGCSAVVVETNQGGELVEETLGRYAPNLPIVEVWAKRGKTLRAEPVALLSDRDRVRLAGLPGSLAQLTTQMKTYVAPAPGERAKDSPDRLDAFVYSVLYLLPVDGGLDELVKIVRSSGRR